MTEQQIQQLITLFPGEPSKVGQSQQEIEEHGSSFFYLSHRPEVVCYPESDDDVIVVMDFCFKNKIPLTPYGGGTSVEGHTAAIHGGICLDMRRMNKVLQFNPISGYALVEPGISYNRLNDELSSLGYHFFVEAGFGATIGGMTATNASGAGALDVGSMRENVRYCEAIVYVNGKAEKLKTGTLASKTSADLSVKSLLIGSEGTLGVITKIAVNIRKNFSCSQTLLCQPKDIEQAIELYVELKDQVRFRRVEWLDALQTEACLFYSEEHFSLDSHKNTLLMELAGESFVVEHECKLVLEKLAQLSVHPVQVFSSAEAAKSLWMMRKQAGMTAIHYFGAGKKAKSTDVAVPLHALTACIKECYERMHTVNIQAPCIAHIGQANFHFKLLMDMNNAEEVEKMEKFDAFVTETALKYQGTCTGEHGIGMGYKLNFLEKEFGTAYLKITENIKQAMDPLNILNPGKKIK
jgi:D-lactate dehydrogenase (cytochrome)